MTRAFWCGASFAKMQRHSSREIILLAVSRQEYVGVLMTARFSAMLHIPGDVRDAIAFYGKAFGAETGWATPPADDMVAQLLVHGIEFWVHPADEAIGNPSPALLGGTAVRLMLIVDDPDAVFNQAVAAGAVVRSPMQDHDYGWRDGSLMDPFGHRWEIGKPL